jgi:pSer/pThr/pTyr-binding forkhead associated (FHA) protein
MPRPQAYENVALPLMGSMKRYLLIEEHPLEGREIALAPGHMIGREGCEIVLPDPEVSRRHAVLRALDDELAIEDLASTNGTWVNGQLISGVQVLAAGDSLRFGNTVAVVHEAGARTRISDPRLD